MPKLRKVFIALYVLFAIGVLGFTYFINNKPSTIVPYDQRTDFTTSYLDGVLKDKLSEAADSVTYAVVANSGKEKGQTLSVVLSATNNYSTYRLGDDVLIYKDIDNSTGNISYEIADFYHQNGLIYLFVIFVVITFLVVRKKGLTSIVSVLLSLGLFYFFFLKMVGLGQSILLSCLLFITIVTILTIPLIHGFNKKSLSSIVAIFTGYLISIFACFLFKGLVQLGNTPGDDFRNLAIAFPNLNFSDIIIATLLMGAIGALIDTSVSIASAVFEGTRENVSLKFHKVYNIGMAVGKDILGSMINTLLFAYLASSLPFLLLLSLNKTGTLSDLVNIDFIALELTRTFIGAILLVIIIPLVSVVSAFLLTKYQRAEK